jgi:hypothetical protein
MSRSFAGITIRVSTKRLREDKLVADLVKRLVRAIAGKKGAEFETAGSPPRGFRRDDS